MSTTTSKDLLRAVCEQHSLDPDDPLIKDVFAQSDKLLIAFWNAVIDHASYAERAAERDGEQCRKSVDGYLEHHIYNLEELRSCMQNSAYTHTFRLIQLCKQMYVNQLLVLDRILMDCPKNQAFNHIRTAFIGGCTQFMQLKVVSANNKIAEIVANARDYRKEEVDENSQSEKFYADCKVYAAMKEYFEEECKRSLDYCKEVARISLQYCKDAIDRSIEANVPVFDELINWNQRMIESNINSFDSIKQKKIDQLSTRSMGNAHLNEQMNFSLSIINYSKQELKSFLLREQRAQLDQYRIDDRRRVIEQYQSSFITCEEDTIERQFFEDSQGIVSKLADRDLSECEMVSIGEGGQGTVYSLNLDGKKVVAKQFRNEKDRKEISNLCRISNHPNILKMIGRGYRGDEWFLVVEYCPLSLADVLRKTRMSNKRVLDKEDFVEWITQLTRGMNYLHGHIIDLGADVFHGDLKPENILIAADGTLKIADFGVSELIDYSAWFDDKKPIRGTPRYMAPELHRREIDVKSLKKADVWSWAVVVWEMISNRQPFDIIDDKILRVLIGRDSLHPPIPSGTIESLENVLRRCCNPKPVLRPAFRTIVKDVEDVVKEIDILNGELWIDTTSAWRADSGPCK